MKKRGKKAFEREDEDSQENEWKKSEEIYRTLANNISGIVYRVEIKKGNMIFFNNMLKKITGYKSQDLKKGDVCSIDPLIVSEDRQNVVKKVRDAIVRKTPFEIEYRVRNKKGKILHFIERGVPIFENKKPAYIDGVIFDITERKKTEDKIIESEKKYKTLARMLPNGAVHIIDKNLRYVLSEGEILKKLNLSDKKLKGKKVSDVLPKEAFKKLEPIYKRAFRGKPGCVVADLKGITFKVNISPLVEKDGKINQVIVLSQDISEQKKAEEELKRSETFLNSIIENIPDMVFVKDAKEFKFEKMNKAGEILLGLKEKEILGKTLLERFSKSQSDFFLSKDKAVIKKRELMDIPEEFIDTPKGVRILHTKKIPLIDENGNPKYLLGISEDITERKKAEEELRKANQIIEKSPIVAFLWENAEGWPVTYASKNVIALTGYTAEDLISEKKKYDEIIHQKDLERIGKELEQYKKEGKNEFTQNYKIITKKGKIKWIEDRTTIIRDKERNILQYQGIVFDITDRKKADDEKDRFNSFAIDRELRMIHLKKEINELSKKLGIKSKYSFDVEQKETKSKTSKKNEFEIAEDNKNSEGKQEESGSRNAVEEMFSKIENKNKEKQRK